MSENPLFSSFIMLNKHLYELFIQYIVNGRIRAPPETELIEMLPTFQFGAKTDRRALQCKFKSWAKRMNFENGWLVLANAGKVIIPREKCDELIMHLHSKEHSDIDNVICQIRKTYSWTRKNFGMDRDIVVESIMRNCQEEDCHKRMRMEMARLGNSLCSSFPSSYDSEPFPQMPFRMQSPSLPCLSPYPYPIAFPLPPTYFPFPIPFFKNMCALDSLAPGCNKVVESEAAGTSSENKHIMKEKTQEVPLPNAECLPSTSKLSKTKFRRPKTAQQFKILIKAAKENPKDFPEIMGEEKTRFLATVGIAPKSLCSSKTLKKFYKELKQKQFLNRSCVIYRERKILRDKNKLKKVSVEKYRHTYLGLSKEKCLPFSKLALKTTESFADTKDPKKLKREEADNNAFQKRRKFKHFGDEKPIEIITLDSSSDEESSLENDLSPSKSSDEVKIPGGKSKKVRSALEISNGTAASNIHQSTVDFTNETDHTIDTQSTSVSSNVTADPDNSQSILLSLKNVTTDSKNQLMVVAPYVTEDSKNSQSNIISSNVVTDSKNVQTTVVWSNVSVARAMEQLYRVENNKEKISTTDNNEVSNRQVHESEKEDERRKYFTEAIHSKSPLSEKFQNTAVNAKRVLLPKNFSESTFKNTLRISTEGKDIPVPKVISSPADRSHGIIRHHFKQLYPNSVLKPIAVQSVPPHLQIQTVSEPTKQKIVPVYSVPGPSGSNAKFFLIDKNKKEALFVIPPNIKHVLPQNLSKVQSLSIHNSIEAGESAPIGSLASEFHHLKPNITEGEGMFHEKEDFTKIDIYEEMTRITKWIYRMRSNLNPCMFTHGMEKSVLKLLSQLDIAIYLVREAKKSLMDVGQFSDRKSKNFSG